MKIKKNAVGIKIFSNEIMIVYKWYRKLFLRCDICVYKLVNDGIKKGNNNFPGNLSRVHISTTPIKRNLEQSKVTNNNLIKSDPTFLILFVKYPIKIWYKIAGKH